MTIPSDIRRAARLEEGDPIEVEIVAEGILLRPRKVIDATQAWFWTPTWQAGEAEASAELERGEGRVFESGEEFLASLDG
jgi:AbrB family looped-hinge helix DNA binding protein